MSLCNHEFRPRYNEGEIDGGQLYDILNMILPSNITKTITAAKSKTYIHDICIKCGKLIKKENQNNE